MVRAACSVISEATAPTAQNTDWLNGTTTSSTTSSAKSGAWEAPAPPKAYNTKLRGSCPCSMVTVRSRSAIRESMIRLMPAAAFSTDRPSGSAT